MTTYEWNHRTARVNGINMHYVIHGQGSPVILLHGWPEFWYSWRQQIPILAERFQVIAPDMRGFGYSDKSLSGYDSCICGVPAVPGRPDLQGVEDPLEVWQKIFPNVRGKYLGEYGHFLQWEAPEEVNRELLAFLGEGG